MKWWEIPQNCNCIFALDTDSVTSSSKVYFSNKPEKFLTLQNGNNKVYPGLATGFKHKNLINEKPLKYHTYKSLIIAKTNLLFSTPILLSESFTFILKCRLRQNSVLMSNNGASFGLTLGVGDYDQIDEGYWRINGFNAGDQVYSKKQLVPFTGNYIQTVVLKGSINLKDVSFKTDYGTFQIPSNSPAFQNFLQNKTYSHIGYTSSENWQPNIEIIAYGLFDKILTEEEELQIEENLEENFFLKKSNFDFKTSLSYGEEKYYYESNLLKPKNFGESDFLQGSEPVDGSETFINKVKINSEVIVRQTLYKDFENIYDKVLEEGLPVEVKLFLYERNTGILIKTTFSDTEGNFSFLNLNKDLEYFVTANDNKYQFQSVLKNYNN